MLKSLVVGDDYQNDGLNIRTANARSYQDAIPIINEYESIIQRQKRNILSVVYRQRLIFKRFKDSSHFLEVIKKSEISILTINFTTDFTNMIDKFPRLRKSF